MAGEEKPGGDRNIKATQRRLYKKGLYTGDIAGIDGPLMRQALALEPAYDKAHQASELERQRVQGEEGRKNQDAAARIAERQKAP